MQHPRAIVIIGASALAPVALVLFSIQAHKVDRTANQAITGDLVAYQTVTRELTLRTTDGDRRFIVQADTPVHKGAQSIALAALRSAKGCRAKVWCSFEEGNCAVYEIRIFCDAVVATSDSQH